MISDIVRQFVKQRAGYRCEYCLSHQAYVYGKFQIDHILPIALGGADDEDNLCLACELCNQFKWMRTSGVDWLTGERFKLFNPRQQIWSEHFSWSEDGAEIIGMTPCGRVTVDVLRMNNSFSVPVRRNWVSVGWHPPTV